MSERFGLRYAVIGKTRSGKSTAIYQLLSDLIPLNWHRIVVLDGKRNVLEFAASADPRVEYYNAKQVDQWAAVLASLAAEMPDRYEQMEQGKPTLPVLLLADEVQAGTRSPNHKKSIRDSLTLLSEQSGALGDTLILASQRVQNSIPPSITVNCSGTLTMLGHGYFHFDMGDGKQIGRSEFITPEQAQQHIEQRLRDGSPAYDSTILASSDILAMLKPIEPVPVDGRLTMYSGEAGSGLTWYLEQHKSRVTRKIWIDISAETHKQALFSILKQSQTGVPSKVTITDLATMCALAIAAEPTLLLIDNAHAASAKTQASLEHIIPYAAETAVSFAMPKAGRAALSMQRRAVIDFYLSRGKRTEIKPLSKAAATRLAAAHLTDDITGTDHDAALRRALTLGKGHPKTIVSVAQNIERGTLRELREIEGREAPQISLLWLVLVLGVAILMVQRSNVDGYTMTVIVFAATLILRPFVSRSIRDAFEKQ